MSIGSGEAWGGEEESSASESEWKHCRKDGTVFPVEIISQNLEFDGRSVWLVMAEDVSEKKELQEQFFRAQRLESLGLLASGIAHDLNNMLAPVLFSAPLLRSQVKTAQDHHILDLLEKSAARGSSLVRQILSIAQGSSSELRTTQVKQIARDVVSVLEVTLPRNITLKTNIITDAWPVDANPTQIHQVLLNLGVNARDAMPSGGQLSFAVLNRKLDDAAAAKIKGGRSGNWLVVEVADTGTGIPEAVLERMWDSFFTTKAEGKGSGLGLATVRSMVELHRGFVEVETVEKKGTVFRVFLPATETVGAGSQSSHPFPAARGRTELIMVVDDDEMVREITQAVLTDFGYRVIAGVDGVEGIVKYSAKALEIDLLITDVDMPNMNGAVLLTTLRRLTPELKIIGMSGMTMSKGESGALQEVQQKANAFLAKPFTAHALLNTVRAVLEADV